MAALGSPSRVTTLDERDGQPDGAADPGSRLLRYTAPTVLALVAVVHAFLVHTQDLAPWKGGGFAMFSSVDKAQHRAVRVYLEGPAGEVPARVGDDSSVSNSVVVRARNMPDSGALSALADEVIKQEWFYDEQEDGDLIAASADRPEDADPVTVTSVRVEVLRLSWLADQQRVTPVELASLTREVS